MVTMEIEPGHLVFMRYRQRMDCWECPCCGHRQTAEGIWLAGYRP